MRYITDAWLLSYLYIIRSSLKMEYPRQDDLIVSKLGDCIYPSPILGKEKKFVESSQRVLLLSESDLIEETLKEGEPLSSFEMAGARREIFFNPDNLVCGIVTCGGLCPGLNDVIRSVTLTLLEVYGIKQVLGFRYGYSGITNNPKAEPINLTESVVKDIQEIPGTMLGSSRGPQEASEMVDVLEKYGVSILFTVGGDGTLRGASVIAEEIQRRGSSISVIGIPKTIDNDLSWIVQSFGFSTAVEQAKEALVAGHTEARSAWNGVGLVKLMGRHSGFIAAHAALATSIVNFCLIPEVPFALDGERGFLKTLEKRLDRKHHAVVVVAEGAGQELLIKDGPQECDASGNVKLMDIGLYLKQRIKDYFKKEGIEMTIKYIDPSYEIRSLPANSMDSEFCVMLGQYAVHAGMAGCTDMVVGVWNRHFTHVPIKAVVEERKQVEPFGPLWQSVLSSTGQPTTMF
jgi:6-phosphofructokinase 1